MKLRLVLGLWLLLAAAACSGRRLPPGTPPPEYEPPIVAPWPAETSDAGSDAAEPAVHNAEDGPSPAAVGSELSLDAGPR